MALHDDVKERDGFQCQKCGYKPSQKDRLEAHHIVPSYIGGKDQMENMICLCGKCHDAAPTMVLPSRLLEQGEGDIHIDEYPDLAHHFEQICAKYVATGLPPSLDLWMFGMRSRNKFKIPETIEKTENKIQILYEEYDDFQDCRDWEMAWKVTARLSGYIDSGKSEINDILVGESGQLQFREN